VTFRLSPWHGALARVVLAALVLALMPMPAAAAEPGQQPAKATSLHDSIVKNAAREAARSNSASARASQGEKVDKSPLDKPSFFKTPAGAIALAIVAVGAGFAIYSTSHDRIHSVVRVNQ